LEPANCPSLRRISKGMSAFLQQSTPCGR
jgi:hypothetical protein